MELKLESKKTRYEKTAYDTESVRIYASLRATKDPIELRYKDGTITWNEALDDMSGSPEDYNNCIDFSSISGKISMQNKLRHSGKRMDDGSVVSQVIYEGDAFLPIPGRPGEYTTIPGRDARGKSMFTSCKPLGEERLFFPESIRLKEERLKAIKEWGKKTTQMPSWNRKTIDLQSRNWAEKATPFNEVLCDVICLSNEEISSYWKQAQNNLSYKFHTIFTTSLGVEIQFKIDQGDVPVWAKLLYYFPHELLGGTSLNARPGEIIYDRSTHQLS